MDEGLEPITVLSTPMSFLRSIVLYCGAEVVSQAIHGNLLIREKGL
jgi:hypothetical protein